MLLLLCIAAPCHPVHLLCSSTGVAHEVLASLSGALPAATFMQLQQRLMAKGLLKELEVTADFE